MAKAKEKEILQDKVITNEDIVKLVVVAFDCCDSKYKKQLYNQVVEIAKKLYKIYGDNEMSSYITEIFGEDCCIVPRGDCAQ